MIITRKHFVRGALAAVGGVALTRLAGPSAAQTPGSPSRPRSLTGVYVGYALAAEDTRAAIQAFEAVVGRPVDAVAEFGSQLRWDEARTSAAHALRQWREALRGQRRRMLWSQPLSVQAGELGRVAAGQNDAIFQHIAMMLRDNGFADAVVRLGWDMNLDFVPWAVQRASAEEYIAAFRRVAGLFRGISPEFRICWSVAKHVGEVRPETAWPGDDVVDYVGMTVFNNVAFDGTAIVEDADPAAHFDRFVLGHGRTVIEGRAPYGLAWLAEFAGERKKPMVVPEYGTGFVAAGPPGGQGDDEVFVTRMAEWIKAHDVRLHVWRDHPGDGVFAYNSRLSRASAITGVAPTDPRDEKPKAALAFRRAWSTVTASTGQPVRPN